VRSTQACGLKAGSPCLFDLGVVQPAFGTDQESQCGGRRVVRQRLGDRVQHQLQVGFDCQPIGQQLRRVNDRNHRTATLLAGADGDLAPMGQALVGALVLQAYFAAFTDDRRDLRCAQLSRFLDRPIHPLSP